MIIGIVFLILFAFFMTCLIGSLSNIEKTNQLMIKRYDEVIRLLKKK